MNIFFYYDIYVLCFHILMMLFCRYETVSYSKLQLGGWNNILRLTLFHTYLFCRSRCRIWPGNGVHEGNGICKVSDGRMVFVLPYPGDHLNEHHCILMKNSLYYTIHIRILYEWIHATEKMKFSVSVAVCSRIFRDIRGNGNKDAVI